MNDSPARPAASRLGHDPLAAFIATVTAHHDRHPGATGDEAATLAVVGAAMRELVATDGWLDDALARPHPQYYQQYLLHVDPQDRFCVVSFVWGPGQKTPVHDHCTWGVIGMLRGAETGQAYQVDGDRLRAVGGPERLEPGDVAAVSPSIGDIHVVANAFDDRVSISIHAYGTDIGKQARHVYDPVTGARKSFVSGYANRPAA